MTQYNLTAATSPDLKKDDLIVIAGAGGFIAGALTRHFHEQGFTRIRAIDKKPLPYWYQRTPGVENLCLDLSDRANAEKAVEGAAEVYNLAADMGGMGFIERFRIECLRSILINTHLVEAAYRAGARRYFFSSSACAYNTDLQKDPNVRALKESDAYPAMAERLWLGEADERDVLPGVLGGTGHEDLHRASTTSTARTGRGTAAARRLPRRSPARSSRRRTPASWKSTSGATARRPAASASSTTASRAST